MALTTPSQEKEKVRWQVKSKAAAEKQQQNAPEVLCGYARLQTPLATPPGLISVRF